MYYCAALFKHAEALNNTELLAKVREFSILPCLVEHIQKHAYPEDLSWDVALGLAALCDNEDFKTGWAGFFSKEDGQMDREKIAAFLELKANWVDILLAAAPERKRELRPLTDFFSLLQRKMG